MRKRGDQGSIIVAEHHPLYRKECVRLLRRGVPGVAVMETGTVTETITVMNTLEVARLVLVGLNLPDMDGFSGLLEIRRHQPDILIGVVAQECDPKIVRSALLHGASGCIPKSVNEEEYMEVVAMLLSGEIWIHPQDSPNDLRGVSRMNSSHNGVESLTPTQRLVFECLHRGLSNRQISTELGFTVATAKAHVSGVIRKLGVKSRTQVVVETMSL